MANSPRLRIEKHELSVLSRPRVRGEMFCDQCVENVRWLVPEEAMLLARVPLREIFRLIESERIHFAEDVNGFLLVCAVSLENSNCEPQLKELSK